MLPESFDRGLPDLGSCSTASELFEALNQAQWGSTLHRHARAAHSAPHTGDVCIISMQIPGPTGDNTFLPP